VLDRFDMPFEGDDLGLDVGLFVGFTTANARPPELRA
jgi:hypothetical protein